MLANLLDFVYSLFTEWSAPAVSPGV